MPKRLMHPLTVGLIVVVSVLYAFAATPGQKPGIRHISEDVPLDGSTAASSRLPSEGAIDRSAVESGSRTSCADIEPEAGVIVQHDQIGHTWYEYQQNGSIGRMISATSVGYRHFSWMYSSGVYPPPPRYVHANSKNLIGQYQGVVEVDTEGGLAPGFCNQSHMSDGRSAVVYHRLMYQMPDPATPTACYAYKAFWGGISNATGTFRTPFSMPTQARRGSGPSWRSKTITSTW
ncbi:MAG: hypothetical protein WBC88_13090 [Candidatus Zixiibacteriota bacterium]